MRHARERSPAPQSTRSRDGLRHKCCAANQALDRHARPRALPLASQGPRWRDEESPLDRSPAGQRARAIVSWHSLSMSFGYRPILLYRPALPRDVLCKNAAQLHPRARAAPRTKLARIGSFELPAYRGASRRGRELLTGGARPVRPPNEMSARVITPPRPFLLHGQQIGAAAGQQLVVFLRPAGLRRLVLEVGDGII